MLRPKGVPKIGNTNKAKNRNNGTDVLDYRKLHKQRVIKLMEEGQRLYSEKLTIKQVEQATGFKLRVAGAKENPEIICAYVDVDGENILTTVNSEGVEVNTI